MNNMLSVIKKNFPAANEKALEKVMNAKNPLSTSIGRTCIDNGFYDLQAYIAGEGKFEAIIPYIILGRYISKASFNYANTSELELEVNRRLVNFSTTSGTIKSCTYSAWKKFIKNELPEEAFKKASKEVVKKEIDFTISSQKKISMRYVDKLSEEEIANVYTMDEAAKRVKNREVVRLMEEEEKRSRERMEKLQKMLAATTIETTMA